MIFSQAMAKFATRVGDPHGNPLTSPQHADPHGFLVWFSLKRHQVHVDQRVVGWSAGCHVDHPRGWQASPWLARNITDIIRKFLRIPSRPPCSQFFACSEDPRHLKPVILKAVGRIFEISDSNPMQGKCGCGRPSHPTKTRV